jgi:signal transduction histidine kinase
MVALAFCGGAGVLLYLWLWALTPLAEPEVDASASVYRSTPAAALLFALAVVAAIGSLAIEPRLTDVFNSGIALTVLFAGATVAWSLGFDRSDQHRSKRSGVVVRTASAALLVVTGVALLSLSNARPRSVTAVGAIVLIVVGVAVLAAPSIVRLWTDLMGERAARVREVQRAEIAAHLHDSVLQTLALIQVRAGASTEVARLARAQERELRDWLFAGTTPGGNDLATELNDAAAAIELDYPARIEVVVVGESFLPAHPAVVAAAREAMVNAARHAGGDISVYLEFSPHAVDVFVRDRGPGFDLEALPDDRLGVRESIIGRMQRAGGTATVSRASEELGTEVHVHLESGNG